MSDHDLDLIWGAKAIAQAIGKTPRQAHWLLESKRLPAKKVGKQWVISRKVLREFFEGKAA